ncbi:MAG TPA: hypothetical protein VFQ91_28535 [Bryobacteraceae bacterium]|nr:hypothetical protein [Bryobacteraceae bacterium]
MQQLEGNVRHVAEGVAKLAEWIRRIASDIAFEALARMADQVQALSKSLVSVAAGSRSS